MELSLCCCPPPGSGGGVLVSVVFGGQFISLCHTGADILSFLPGIPSLSFREKRPDWSNTQYQHLFRCKRVSQSRFSFRDRCSVGEKCHKESRPPGSLDGEWVPEAAKQRLGPRIPPGVEWPLAAPSVVHLESVIIRCCSSVAESPPAQVPASFVHSFTSFTRMALRAY